MEEPRKVEPELVTEFEILSFTPARIVTNFEIVEAKIKEGLKKYEIEVTAETVPAAKKLIAELNGKSKGMETTRKDQKKKALEPIDEFEVCVKKLVALTLEAAEKIKTQVKVFEDKTLANCKKLMQEQLDAVYSQKDVLKEYRTGDVSILVGLSMLTPSGNLTKAAQLSIAGLAQQGRAKQDLVKSRVAKWEAEALKAGLQSIPSVEMIRPHLDAPDSVFEAKLAQLIKAQVDFAHEWTEKETARVAKIEKDKADAELAEAKKAQEKKLLEENRLAELAREKKNRADFEERQEQVRKQKAIDDQAESDRVRNLPMEPVKTISTPPVSETPTNLPKTQPTPKPGEIPVKSGEEKMLDSAIKYKMPISYGPGPENPITKDVFDRAVAAETELLKYDYGVALFKFPAGNPTLRLKILKMKLATLKISELTDVSIIESAKEDPEVLTGILEFLGEPKNG